MPRSMATKSKPSADLIAHKRIVYPAVSRGRARIGCNCGWLGELAPDDGRADRHGDRAKALDDLFIAHLPSDAMRTYVLVDQRLVPDPSDPEGERLLPAGNFLMPEGRPCVYDRHFESDGIRYVRVIDPAIGDMPVGEIRLADGRVFGL